MSEVTTNILTFKAILSEFGHIVRELVERGKIDCEEDIVYLSELYFRERLLKLSDTMEDKKNEQIH